MLQGAREDITAASPPDPKRRRVAGATLGQLTVLSNQALLGQILSAVGVDELVRTKAYRLSKLFLHVFLSQKCIWKT